jgi:hypothetical protein
MEAEDEKTKQLKVLEQYSRLIDIGTKKTQKIPGGSQTELELEAL